MSLSPLHSTFSANSNITSQDRSEAIDFVNRHNFAFDHWNIEELNNTFAENCVIEHPRGSHTGLAANAKFLDAYKPLTEGIRRVALNHIVDANDDGSLTVTYFNVFIRATRSAETRLLTEQSMHDSTLGLPAIATFSRVIDKIRKHQDGKWRIEYRLVDEVVNNSATKTL